MKANASSRFVLAAILIFAGTLGLAAPLLAAATVPATAVSAGAAPLDINTATVQQLCVLPGIGQAKAEAIVAHRAKHGSFSRIEDLLAVPGIGERILDLIGKRITVKTN